MENIENKKKLSKGIIILIVILSLALVAAVGYIVYDKIILKDEVTEEKKSTDNQDKETGSKNETKGTEEDKEMEISDTALVNDLKEKVGMLEEITYLNNSKYYQHGDIYANGINSVDIPADTKLNNILGIIYSEKVGKSPVTTNYDFGDIPDYYISVLTQFEVSDVEKRYYELYGEKVVSHKSIGKCPTYTYDAANGKYYGAAQCGGTSASSLLIYINKYTKTSNNAYVYVSLGSVNNEVGTIYADYDQKIKFRDIGNADVQIYNNSTNVINSGNYQEFSQYKYTFTKDSDGNYHFVSLERVS